MSELTCSRVISRRMYERSGARGSNRLARRVWPLTQNLSSADRQISASTIGQYRAMATSYRQGTWSHDVSQNIQALLAAVAGPTPYRILDLGCGPGRDLVTFRDLGHVVVGLDGCPEFVAMARAVSGCEVLQQDMLAMTLPRASFDAVFANAVLFHVPSLGLPVVLDRLHAALKPGGVLLASNPRGQDEEGFVDGRYACFYSFTTWRRLVSRSGFALVDHYYRPPGKPRRQQPWLATLWRKSACQISAALAEGATSSANLVRRLRRFAP
jgi:SAM-dependent methyltransferase